MTDVICQAFSGKNPLNEILFVANSSQATPTGGGRTRIISEASQLRKLGFGIKILCFFPPHHIFTRFLLLISGRKKLSREAKSKVYYVPRLPMTRVSWINSLNSWYCGLCILLLCWYYNIRIVHGHGTQAALFGLLVKAIKKDLRIVADFHGAGVEEYLYGREKMGIDRIAERLLKNENTLLRQADQLIFVSEAMRTYFEEREGLNLTRAVVIPCATEPSFEIVYDQRQELRREHALSDKLVFCYIGSSEAYQLPEKMSQLFRSMLSSFPNAFFLIISHHKEVFQQHLKAVGIAQQFYKVIAVDHADVFQLLQIADIGLLLRNASIVNRVASPTKFAEYCLCGVPVICTDSIGDISEMVQRYEIGFSIDTTDISMSDALIEFVSQVQDARLDYAIRCNTFAREHLSWNIYGEVLARIYFSLLELDAQKEHL